jgi:hypothetical protein
MLAIVQNEQQAAISQSLLHRLDDALTGFFPHAEYRGDFLWHQGRIGQGREPAEPNPIGEAWIALQLARQLECQASLTDSTRPGQGQQSRVDQNSVYVAQLQLAADEAA